MNNLVLCSTLSDPKGAFLKDLEKAVPVILSAYQKWVVNVVGGTDEEVKKSLLEMGVVVVEREGGLASDPIEADHLSALFHAERIAQKEGTAKIQYMDGDRVLFAATHYPEEFERMAETMEEKLGKEGSYINGRRAPEDFFSHHPPLVETELEFNRLYSKALGFPLDVGSTIHGFSRDVVSEIIRKSPEKMNVTFPHSKWLLIAKAIADRFGSVELPRVGGFETPQQFKKEVAERLELIPSELTEYEGLRLAYMATLGKESTVSPAEWKRRFTLYHQYIDILENELPHLSLGKEKQAAAKNLIEQSRAFMKRKEAIVSLPPEVRAELEGVKEIRERSRERLRSGAEGKE